jgi:LmbE family N-acetylglucosaminyl deacetylase
MKLYLDTAEIFIPDGQTTETALARTTHMGIGAHQDDLEIMALSGILECFQHDDKWFCGVVVTNGSGSPREDLYKDYTDEEMCMVRRKEQKKAAIIGEYSAQVLLDYPSSAVKGEEKAVVIEDIGRLIQAAKPEVVYTHNLADKHDTHVGVALRVIETVRKLEAADRPQKIYGCEVWRDLDWVVDEDKVTFDVSARENLQAALLGVFDSQITGGKRYDLATMGRRRANATYFESHGTDIVNGMIYAIDLTPLMEDANLDIHSYLQGFIQRTSADLQARLARLQVTES